ncbi:esterase E4-like [Copidosoma floridanum]|uniref:esterase E4-like n=1 Tax=Copidosoma floridanum TaxID=29053 RepID=UPI0006C9D877|nr:esterase E4-like [Copidosoma floridanum]
MLVERLNAKILIKKECEVKGKNLLLFEEWYGNPGRQWLPVVEPEVRGIERFLPAQPIDLIRQGKFHKVPFITGVTRDEFEYKVIGMIEQAKSGNDSMFRDLNDRWEKLAPINFYYERGGDRSKEISRKLREFYLQGKPVGADSSEGLAHLFADSGVGYPVHKLVHTVANASDQPVYYYEFTYQGPYSHVVWNSTNKPYVLYHMCIQ